MSRFTLEMTVVNDYGVLNRITSLFTKRGFKIDSLNMKVAENPEYAYMQIVSVGDEKTQKQALKQVSKLYDVMNLNLVTECM